MAEDRVKRAFIWLRKTMRITDKTTLPGAILGEIRPGIDTFGWDRLAPESAGEGVGPTNENAQSNLATDSVVLSAVPTGVMRYVIRASCSHNDPVAGGLELSMQVRSGGLDVAITQSRPIAANPCRNGLDRNILLAPGEILLARSTPAPAAGTRIFIRYQFVDIDFGEYIRSF